MTETAHLSGSFKNTPGQKTKPDLTAKVVSKDGDKAIWSQLFAVWKGKQDGYFKGKDKDGHTIIVQTLDAKNALLEQQGMQPLTSARSPDLFIYREDVEDGEKIWTQILVAWTGKKDGYFTGKDADGNDVVMQTREAKDAALKRQPVKQAVPVDLDI